MSSGKMVIAVLLSLYLLAAVGVALMVSGVKWGRYFVYTAVPLGAIGTMGASIGALVGKVGRDNQ